MISDQQTFYREPNLTRLQKNNNLGLIHKTITFRIHKTPFYEPPLLLKVKKNMKVGEPNHR